MNRSFLLFSFLLVAFTLGACASTGDRTTASDQRDDKQHRIYGSDYRLE